MTPNTPQAMRETPEKTSELTERLLNRAADMNGKSPYECLYFGHSDANLMRDAAASIMQTREKLANALSAGNAAEAVHERVHADALAQIEALKGLCAAMYQAAGAYDMPVRFMDALSAAANGMAFDWESLLPCDMPNDQQTIYRLESELAAAKRDGERGWEIAQTLLTWAPLDAREKYANVMKRDAAIEQGERNV